MKKFTTCSAKLNVSEKDVIISEKIEVIMLVFSGSWHIPRRRSQPPESRAAGQPAPGIKPPASPASSVG